MKSSVVYIVSALRTPIGSFGGILKDISATQLGSLVIREDFQEQFPGRSTGCVYGCRFTGEFGTGSGQTGGPICRFSGHVNCTTVNKVCASGMKSIAMGAQHILLGDSEVVVAGGMESMSNVPFYADQMRWGNKYGNSLLIDGLAKDGLTDVYDGKAMGNAAELCASTCGISREAQDEFAIESYRRAQDNLENRKIQRRSYSGGDTKKRRNHSNRAG